MHSIQTPAQFLYCLLFLGLTAAAGEVPAAVPDRDEVIRLSQSVIGEQLGHYELRDSRGRPVDLADYRGVPLIISPIYTSCADVCLITTENLARAIHKARAALGEQSFRVVTIGFDPPHDNPAAMAEYARRHNVSDPDWAFLSGDPETIRDLMRTIGFSYWQSPKGYDHLTQTTIVDGDGVIYAQVYGELMHLPQLVEPLKRLVFGIDSKRDGLLDTIVKRVSYFCTDYDPVRDAYRFDYSLFLGMIIGAVSIAAVLGFLIVNLTAQRRRRHGTERAVQLKPNR